MKIDIKTIATYATIFITIGITWGMFTERLDAVEGNKVIDMYKHN